MDKAAATQRHWRSLSVDPQRLRDALTITGLVLVTATIGMTIGMPEAALSCYLIFFAYKGNGGDNILTGLRLILAGSFAILLAIPLLRGVIDQPMLRVFAIAGFTFGGMYLSQASKLGPLAATAGFVFAFMLTLLDIIPDSELINRALAWIWVVLALPMLLLIVWGMFGARRPVDLLQEWIATRSAPMAPQTRTALLDEGLGEVEEMITGAKVMGEARGAAAADLAAQADATYYALSLQEAGLPPRAVSAPPKPEKPAFLVPDALHDPRYIRFGLKVLIAVMLTYGFYTAFGLFSIHTAMITCFYVALGTSGQTNHRLTLRLLGCLLGAVAGVLVMTFVMPHASDIGHLLLILAPVTFIAAWIGQGGERISYAGWQMALCYFLVVLSGFGPPTSISAATDRIIGILLGGAVMWGVFTALWPESASRQAQAALARMDALLKDAPPPQNGHDIARLRAPLAEAAQLAEMVQYERTSPVSADQIRAEVASARLRFNAFLQRSLT